MSYHLNCGNRQIGNAKIVNNKNKNICRSKDLFWWMIRTNTSLLTRIAHRHINMASIVMTFINWSSRDRGNTHIHRKKKDNTTSRISVADGIQLLLKSKQRHADNWLDPSWNYNECFWAWLGNNWCDVGLAGAEHVTSFTTAFRNRFHSFDTISCLEQTYLRGSQ
jgi:hypothetical protein